MAIHIVVALIALVAIGGATRVMEAGLACPDWPLCYGSFFPRGKMNMQVFLEWFHRLDAFFVGITILIQFISSIIYRSFLPRFVPWISGLIVALVSFQGLLGALTVSELLRSGIVMAHLFLALTMVAFMSGLAQRLYQPEGVPAPFWWRSLGLGSLVAVFAQCLVGGRMATTWSAHVCINNNFGCEWLNLHRLSAIPVALGVTCFVSLSLYKGGWFRAQWPLLISVFALLIFQLMLGVLSLKFHLNQPFLIVSHQLIAALLVALLAALSFRRPHRPNQMMQDNLENLKIEVCHG